MSVYTTVTAERARRLAQPLPRRRARRAAPIAAGIENTNYFVTTEGGRYVLTLYERLPADELPFYLNLMAHLARAGVEVPAPEPDRTGALFSLLNGRPAGLVARIDGASVERPDRAHCAAVGDALARLHVASQTLSRAAHQPPRTRVVAAGGARRAPLPHATSRTQLLRRRDQVPDRLRQGLRCRRARSTAISSATTCCSPTAASSGIIDFGFAATDFFAYDLAITVNDWCVGDDATGALDDDACEGHGRAPTRRCGR